jgi:uncharacterized protein YukE
MIDTARRRERGPLIVAALVGLVAAGCASVVYKDTASNYLTSARAFQKAVEEAANSVANAEDSVKVSKLVTDPSCPIDDSRVFVRNPDVTPQSFAAGFERFPDLRDSGSCKALRACEAPTRETPWCAQTCYSAEEANCIVNLDVRYGLALRPKKAPDGRPIEVPADVLAEAEVLSEHIDRIEVGRKRLTPNKILGDGLVVLSGYLDLLGKVVDKRSSTIKEDAESLNKRITSVIDEYIEITGAELSPAAKKSREQVGTQIAALGKLANDVETIAKNAEDSKGLKEIVLSQGDSVKEIIATVRPIAAGDGLLGIALGDLNTATVREEIAARYAAAGSDYERRRVYAEMQAVPYGQTGDVLRKLDEAFNLVSESHDTLMQLIRNPSEKQLQAIRAEQLQNFRTILSDVLSAIDLF